MSYENAPSTRRLAVNCLCCGRPLRDAKSVEIGIGPVCRKKHGYDGVAVPNRELSNKLIHEATLSAEDGDVKNVLLIAEKLEGFGLVKLAGVIRDRFVTLKIEQKANGGGVEWIGVYTPWHDGWARSFHGAVPRMGTVDGCRVDIKKRVNHDNGKFKCWAVRVGWKRGVLKALAECFPGKYCQGPKGIFRIPTLDEYNDQYARGER